eukprot:gene1115-1420_t
MKTLDKKELIRIRDSPFIHLQSEEDELLESIKEIPSRPLLDVSSSLHQEYTHKTVLEIAKKGFVKVQYIRDDPKRMLLAMSSLSRVVDFSAAAKTVIHYQLFGGTILVLGSDYHHKKYLDDINNLKIVGGFAMTEIGHGSNVRNIETVSLYDHTTQEFIVNSPTVSSTKFWIGNVAKYGTHVVLFTRLIFKGEDKGVHAIIVQIRDLETGKVRDGVELGPCGPKTGWNGVDNGWIRFKNYRVPRENLLNKFADINERGEYKTTISSPGKLFQITISQLVLGRLFYIIGPTLALNICLKTATHYAFSRKQFGEKGKPEQLIINYPTHYQVLIPMIATNFAIELARNTLIERLCEPMEDEKVREEFHSIVSGVKAFTTEYVVQSLSKLRVMCGGHGVSSYNLIGVFRNEIDIFQTAEGDGTVLYQQLCKYLLSEYKSWYKREGVTGYIIKEMQAFLYTSNPIYTHSRSMLYILSDQFHFHAFSFRFEKIRSILIEKLNYSKSKGMTFMESWNNSLLYVVDLAKAYTQLYILEQSHLNLKKCTNISTREILIDFIKLYALSNIEKDFAFYRNYNFISAGKAIAISDAVRELCLSLKPYIITFVDSFKMCDDCFNIPLAHEDHDYARHLAARVGIDLPKKLLRDVIVENHIKNIESLSWSCIFKYPRLVEEKCLHLELLPADKKVVIKVEDFIRIYQYYLSTSATKKIDFKEIENTAIHRILLKTEIYFYLTNFYKTCVSTGDLKLFQFLSIRNSIVRSTPNLIQTYTDCINQGHFHILEYLMNQDIRIQRTSSFVLCGLMSVFPPDLDREKCITYVDNLLKLGFHHSQFDFEMHLKFAIQQDNIPFIQYLKDKNLLPLYLSRRKKRLTLKVGSKQAKAIIFTTRISRVRPPNLIQWSLNRKPTFYFYSPE